MKKQKNNKKANTGLKFEMTALLCYYVNMKESFNRCVKNL